MRREPNGFWSVDSSKLLRATKEPYILPSHCQQAFYYKNPNTLESNWWQIIHVNPRGRRIFDSGIQTESVYTHQDDDSNVEEHVNEAGTSLPNNDNEDIEQIGQISQINEDSKDIEQISQINEESEDSEEDEVDDIQLLIPIDITQQEREDLRLDMENINIFMDIPQEETP